MLACAADEPVQGILPFDGCMFRIDQWREQTSTDSGKKCAQDLHVAGPARHAMIP